VIAYFFFSSSEKIEASTSQIVLFSTNNVRNDSNNDNQSDNAFFHDVEAKNNARLLKIKKYTRKFYFQMNYLRAVRRFFLFTKILFKPTSANINEFYKEISNGTYNLYNSILSLFTLITIYLF
jgi:hypothetical protein